MTERELVTALAVWKRKLDADNEDLEWMNSVGWDEMESLGDEAKRLVEERAGK